MKTKILISEKQITARVKALAKGIVKDYKGLDLTLVGVLDGAYILMSDLSKELYKLGLKNFEVAFIGISSYGSSRESSKNPLITKDLGLDILKKHVLLVEDIVDTGWSLDFLQRYLSERKPASLKTLVLLSKKERREIKVPIEYIGFKIENKWVEGYGLDTDYKGRGNPDIIEKSV